MLVSVPAPARFALHKLIVSRRRRDGDAKRDKDLAQAWTLLDALVRRRPADLRAAWVEATGRGRTWQRLLAEGLAGIDPRVQEKVLATVGNPAQPTES